MRRLLVEVMLVLVVALATGLGSALLVLEQSRNRGAISIGPWIAAPDAGDENPYAAAIAATTLDLPFGVAEGIVFTARNDSEGETLSSRCTYRIAGTTPLSQLWTLTVYDVDTGLMENPANRTGVHSREIVRDPDGAFSVVVSAAAHSGNWVPVTDADRLIFVFRLYDTRLTTGLQVNPSMPSITAENCA